MLSYGLLKKVRELSVAQLADIALQMAEVHPETFLKAMADPALQGTPITVGDAQNPEKRMSYTVPNTGMAVSFTLQQDAMLRRLGRDASKKVEGIKEIRAITNIGLKEAKDLFEKVFYNV